METIVVTGDAIPHAGAPSSRGRARLRGAAHEDHLARERQQ